MAFLAQARRELQPAHFTFQIQSYSLLSEKCDDGYQSGIFEAGGYKWRLVFYPNGNKKRNSSGHISLYLAIDQSNYHSDINWNIPVSFKFLVHNQIENLYLPYEEAGGVVRDFNRNKKEWGCDRLLTAEAFQEPSNGFLKDDSCAFGVEVFVIERSESAEIFKMVPFKASECSLRWEIPNFRKNSRKKEISPDQFYTVEERNWKIKICPMGEGEESFRSLALYLILAEGEKYSQENRKVYAKFKLRIVNHRQKNNHAEKQLSHWFPTVQSKDSQRGSIDIVPLLELYDKTSGYLKNDGTLTVQVEFLVLSAVE